MTILPRSPRRKERVKPFTHKFTKGNRRGLDFEEVRAYYDSKYNDYIFALIPLYPYNKIINGKERGKTPIQRNWQKSDPSKFGPMAHMIAGGNIGVRIEEGLLVIDVDPRNYKNGIDSLIKLQRDFGFQIHDHPHVITGRDGFHIYMLLPEGLTGLRATHPKYPGIEFKTNGYVVAAGSIHPNGITYEWGICSPPLDKMRKAPGRLLDILKREKPASSEEVGRHTPEQLEKMLAGLNVAKFRIHIEWLALMMACHHATAGDGKEEFVEWSTSDPYYANQADKIRERWDSLDSKGTGKITYKTLYHRLHSCGKGALIPPPSTAEEDFEAVDPEDCKLYVA